MLRPRVDILARAGDHPRRMRFHALVLSTASLALLALGALLVDDIRAADAEQG